LIVYDIFGFSPQSLQGADILAYGNKDEQYQVYVPDFLLGKYANHTWFPPDTAEKGAAMVAFFAGPANPVTTVQKIPGLVQTITERSSGTIESWAIVGMCWGGKVCSTAVLMPYDAFTDAIQIVSFSCGDGTPFKAAAEVHPSMIDPNDAPGIKVPIAILASGDEDAKDVKGFVDALKVPHYSETFGDQVHVRQFGNAKTTLTNEYTRVGWLHGTRVWITMEYTLTDMANSGDLVNGRSKAEYERGYATLLEFL